MKKTFTAILTICTLFLAASCSQYDDSIVREYTPEAIGDNAWTADVDTTVVEDKDVPGLLPSDPEFRGTLVSELSAYYNGNLTVTINEQSTEPSQQQVLIRAVDDNHINFGLKNFILVSEDDVMLVGTIVLKNIEIKKNAEGKLTFDFEQNINILTGDTHIIFDGEEVELEEGDWVGPMLGAIPVSITGVGNANDMTIGIDINMESLGQIIHVDFIAK